jgi:hypothetical protein
VLASPLAVFLALAVFAYPATDDWVFAAMAQDRGIVAGTLDHLRGWGGRFTAIPANLLVHSLPYPWLAFPAAIAANLLGLVLAWRMLLPRDLAHPWLWSVAAAGLLAATLPSRAEGLYWLCGMIAYVAPFTLVAVLVGTLLRWPERRWLPPMLAAGGVLVAGCGETATILAGSSACGLWLLGQHRARWLVWGLAAGAALSLAAPGTWVRLSQAGGPAMGDGDRAGSLILSWELACGLLRDLGRGPTPFALLAAAVLGARCPVRPPAWLPLVAAPLMVLGTTLALAPSQMALGMVEGRQRDAAWCQLLPWALACAWWLGARHPAWLIRPAAAAAAPGLIVAGILAVLLTAAGEPRFDSLAMLAAWMVGLLVLGGGVWWMRRATTPWLLAGMAVLAMWMSGPLAVGWLDLLVRAPHRRGEQWARDAGVRTLAAQGVRHLRVPFPDPNHFPSTISVGDLANASTWWNRAYARRQGVETVACDPRCVAAEPLPAPR